MRFVSNELKEFERGIMAIETQGVTIDVAALYQGVLDTPEAGQG